MPRWSKMTSVIMMSVLATVTELTGQAPASEATGFPESISHVSIQSSLDQSDQPALCYWPTQDDAPSTGVPLLVGLHTWSGDYTQAASTPMANWCLEHSWAFVHPNFRGPNWTPDACGSDKAVQDVLDAVQFMMERTRIDPARIYLMGTSGGGHMSLLVAGRHPQLWAGVSAWVPIADLSAWYFECQIAGQRYALDLLKVIGAPPNLSAKTIADYQHRSPITWLHQARSVPIDINAGIRDGHDGSVPISHSFAAFNCLANAADKIPAQQILEFTGKSKIPPALRDPDLQDPTYGKRSPLFRRTSGKARITIFNGGHEGIPEAGLSWLAKQVKLRQ